MATYHLYRWNLVYTDNNPYIAPEVRKISLYGFRDQDTKPVLTTTVMKTNGKEVTTRSGSVYILEDIDPDYRRWIDEQGLNFDPDNPVKLIKK